MAAIFYNTICTLQLPMYTARWKLFPTKTPVRFRILWWHVFSLDILYPFPVPGEEMGNYSTIFDLSVYLYSWVSFIYRYKYFTMRFPVIIFRLNIDAFLDFNGICDVYNFIQWVLCNFYPLASRGQLYVFTNYTFLFTGFILRLILTLQKFYIHVRYFCGRKKKFWIYSSWCIKIEYIKFTSYFSKQNCNESIIPLKKENTQNRLKLLHSKETI